MALLLGGCQLMQPQEVPPSKRGFSLTATDTPTANPSVQQCGPQSILPALDGHPASSYEWIELHDAMATMPLLQRWSLVMDPHATQRQKELAILLIHFQADSPVLLKQLAQVELERQLPTLPETLQPVFRTIARGNETLLRQDISLTMLKQELARQQGSIKQLRNALAEKERQIEALTDIESQLNTGTNQSPLISDTPLQPPKDLDTDNE